MKRMARYLGQGAVYLLFAAVLGYFSTEPSYRHHDPAKAMIKLSFDGGRTWSGQHRISPAAAMVGMAELADGSIFIAMHEGYRVGQYIRAQRFRVTSDGPVAVP